MDLPNKKYKIIYADPPWEYQDKGCSGNAEDHYNTMKVEEICSLPIKEIVDRDSVLFLWTTYPMLKEALMVIESWGFEYKTIAFQWIKKNKSGSGFFYGLGRWTRGNTEPCLLSTKGKPHRIDKSIFQIIADRIKEHSRKPDRVRELIVKLMGDLPRIELFARQRFEGWDAWGLEKPNTIQRTLTLTLKDRT